MTNVEDVKDLKEETKVQVLSDDEEIEVKGAKEVGEEDVAGDDDEEFDAEEEDDDDDDDDDDEDEDEEEEEDLGTEYLVKPVAEADDEDESDFEPEENGVEEDIEEEVDEEEDVDDVCNLSAGKSDPLAKRKRVPKVQDEQADVAGEEERPAKRLF